MTDIQKGYAARNRANALLKLRNRNVIMSVPRQMPNYQPALKRASPQEVNYVDKASAFYSHDVTGSISLIATISQGASVNQRIGKRAMYKSILMRGSTIAGSTGIGGDYAWLIVYDKRPTGALPLITDILTAINTVSFMNDNNTARFQVVRRHDDVLIGNTTTPTTGKEMVNLDLFIKFRAPITFESAGTGAIGDIDMGALYFITVGNGPAGTTAPLTSASFRVRFTEQ